MVISTAPYPTQSSALSYEELTGISKQEIENPTVVAIL
jgi:hypothetical protein